MRNQSNGNAFHLQVYFHATLHENLLKNRHKAVAKGVGDRGGGGVDLLALPAFLPSVISSFFTQNKEGRPPGPLPYIRYCKVTLK